MGRLSMQENRDVINEGRFVRGFSVRGNFFFFKGLMYFHRDSLSGTIKAGTKTISERCKNLSFTFKWGGGGTGLKTVMIFCCLLPPPPRERPCGCQSSPSLLRPNFPEGWTIPSHTLHRARDNTCSRQDSVAGLIINPNSTRVVINS